MPLRRTLFSALARNISNSRHAFVSIPFWCKFSPAWILLHNDSNNSRSLTHILSHTHTNTNTCCSFGFGSFGTHLSARQIVATRKVHTLDPIRNRIGWAHLSPNVATFIAWFGAIGSIGTRIVLVWNAVMLVVETAFYPHDLYTLLTRTKVEWLNEKEYFWWRVRTLWGDYWKMNTEQCLHALDVRLQWQR